MSSATEFNVSAFGISAQVLGFYGSVVIDDQDDKDCVLKGDLYYRYANITRNRSRFSVCLESLQHFGKLQSVLNIWMIPWELAKPNIDLLLRIQKI